MNTSSRFRLIIAPCLRDACASSEGNVPASCPLEATQGVIPVYKKICYSPSSQRIFLSHDASYGTCPCSVPRSRREPSTREAVRGSDYVGSTWPGSDGGIQFRIKVLIQRRSPMRYRGVYPPKRRQDAVRRVTHEALRSIV